jgi:hypothetical protein
VVAGAAVVVVEEVVVTPARASAGEAISAAATIGPAVASAVAIASTEWATPPSAVPPPDPLAAWIVLSTGQRAAWIDPAVASKGPMGEQPLEIAERISGIGQ